MGFPAGMELAAVPAGVNHSWEREAGVRLDTVARSSSWLPMRLRMALALWLLAGAVLALIARNGASMIALSATLLGILYLYACDGLPEPGARSRDLTPRGEITGPADSHVWREADHFILREFAAAQCGRPLALVMFGFPGLSGLVEGEGPTAADAAVVEFGRVLRRMTRRMNLSARYGWRAETFLSVLSGADVAGAQAFVARVRDTCTKLDLQMPEIAVGIAVYKPHMHSPEELVAAAEQALAGEKPGSPPPVSAATFTKSNRRISSRARAV